MYSHTHECESEYPCMHSSKDDFACIQMVAVHIDTSTSHLWISLVRAGFCAGRVFIQTIWSKQYLNSTNLIYTSYDAHVT